MYAHSPFYHIIVRSFQSVVGLFDCNFEFSLYRSGQRAGVLRNCNGVMSRFGIWFSPRKPAGITSAIFDLSGDDFLAFGIDNLYFRFYVCVS